MLEKKSNNLEIYNHKLSRNLYFSVFIKKRLSLQAAFLLSLRGEITLKKRCLTFKRFYQIFNVYEYFMMYALHFDNIHYIYILSFLYSIYIQYHIYY